MNCHFFEDTSTIFQRKMNLIFVFIHFSDENRYSRRAGIRRDCGPWWIPEKLRIFLHITQTAITQRLRHLEDFLGVALIERTTRSVSLTTIGEEFLPRARPEVQRSSTAVGLVAEGIAAAVVPRLAIQDGAYSRLRLIPLADPAISRTLVLLVRKGARLSPAAQALYDLIVARSSA